MYTSVQFLELSMKRLFKSAALSLAAALLLFSAAGCSARSAWADGWYSGSGEGVHGVIKLSVSVEKGRIAEIRIDEQHETKGVSEVALDEIPRAIIKAQSTEVDTVAGASVTSEGIIAAVEMALTEAEEAKE